MEEMMMHDPSGMVLYEEEVTTAHELPPLQRTWHDEGPVGYELTDTKCYKTPSGVQKTATIQHVPIIKEPPPMMAEQIVEMDGEFSMDGTDMHAFPYSSSQPSTSSACDPSSSDAYQPEPLSRISIKIGERILRFKVINATEAPEAPLETSERWIPDPKPVTTPKSLAGLFHCTQCKTYFGNKEVYQRHVLESHGDARPFRCFNCGMRFSNKTAMTNHLKDHALLKVMYSCDYCPRVFAKIESKMRHHKLHFTRSSCPTCMRFFTTEEALRNHQATAHQQQVYEDCPHPEDLLPNGKTARFNCSYCALRFHFRKDKEIHERIHTGEKPYECGYCQKSFAQSQALTAHIRTHTKEQPYACLKCSKRFRDNSCLRKHELAVHTDTPIVRPVAVEYRQQLEKQLEQQREQRRKQEMMITGRNPNFRL